MTILHDVKITPLERIGLYAVTVDGKPIKGVTDIQIEMATDSIPVVRLGFMAKAVEVELNNASVREGKTEEQGK